MKFPLVLALEIAMASFVSCRYFHETSHFLSKSSQILCNSNISTNSSKFSLMPITNQFHWFLFNEQYAYVYRKPHENNISNFSL